MLAADGSGHPVPVAAASEDAASEDAVSAEAAPGVAAPGAAAPGVALAGDAAPGVSVAGGALPVAVLLAGQLPGRAGFRGWTPRSACSKMPNASCASPARVSLTPAICDPIPAPGPLPPCPALPSRYRRAARQIGHHAHSGASSGGGSVVAVSQTSPLLRLLPVTVERTRSATSRPRLRAPAFISHRWKSASGSLAGLLLPRPALPPCPASLPRPVLLFWPEPSRLPSRDCSLPSLPITVTVPLQAHREGRAMRLGLLPASNYAFSRDTRGQRHGYPAATRTVGRRATAEAGWKSRVLGR